MTLKAEYLKSILEKIGRGETIIMAGVGSGLTAKGAREGGADLLATYNTAVYRIEGLSTALAFLPYDNCNELAFRVLPQVLAAAGDIPVMLGLGAHDPREDLQRLVYRAKEMGAAGITNEPFIGMYEGDLRRQLEAANLGFSREVELIRVAAESGMLTLAYVFTENEAIEMAYAGADFLGVMVGGVTSGGSAGGVETISLDDAVQVTNRVAEALKNAGKACPIMIHGGPLNDVGPVRQVLEETAAAGYITGSTGERVPAVEAVREKIAAFSAIRKG